jgi:hypothetical protein
MLLFYLRSIFMSFQKVTKSLSVIAHYNARIVRENKCAALRAQRNSSLGYRLNALFVSFISFA